MRTSRFFLLLFSISILSFATLELGLHTWSPIILDLWFVFALGTYLPIFVAIIALFDILIRGAFALIKRRAAR